MFQITATTAFGIALLSCSPRHRVVYLPPPPTYWGSPHSAAFASPPRPMAYSSDARSETPPQSDVHVLSEYSPHRAAVKAKQGDPKAKFKSVQAKVEKIGVENLTQDDIAGLSPAQLKVLRGY